MTDQQRTRSDKNKLQAPRAQLHSVSEREEAAGFAFASQIQRSPLPHPTFTKNTSPNNPFFSLGVKLHRPENPTDDHQTQKMPTSVNQQASNQSEKARRSLLHLLQPKFRRPHSYRAQNNQMSNVLR
jgi:hypothetical protein